MLGGKGFVGRSNACGPFSSSSSFMQDQSLVSQLEESFFVAFSGSPAGGVPGARK